MNGDKGDDLYKRSLYYMIDTNPVCLDMEIFIIDLEVLVNKTLCSISAEIPRQRIIVHMSKELGLFLDPIKWKEPDELSCSLL